MKWDMELEFGIHSKFTISYKFKKKNKYYLKHFQNGGQLNFLILNFTKSVISTKNVSLQKLFVIYVCPFICNLAVTCFGISIKNIGYITFLSEQNIWPIYLVKKNI